jgi:hypothetical protein
MALKDNNIDRPLNIETSGAREQIQQLTDKNRELEKSSEAIRGEMTKLAARGKQNTSEYKLLADQLKANSLQMAENNAKIAEVSKTGEAPTGVPRGPALVSGRGNELIVSSPHLKLLQRHVNYPYILSAINDVRSGRVPRHAAGSYDTAATDAPVPEENYPNWNRFSESLDRLTDTLDVIKANGIRAVVGLDEFDATRKLRDESRALGTLS